MLKVKIWVNAKGWIDGGFYNILYFKNKAELDEWCKNQKDVNVISVKEVTLEEFAEDYIG